MTNSPYDAYLQMLNQQMNSQNQLAQAQLGNQMYGLGNASAQNAYQPPRPVAETAKKGQSMFKEITTDIKAFILEHRGVIYFLVFALMIDQFFFKGAFKARLQSCVDKLVARVEEKIAQ